MFWVEIQYFSTVLGGNTILFKCFGSKHDNFECFGSKYVTFRMFSVEIRYFSNVLDRNTILFECFGSKYGTFRMFCVEIRYFSNVLGRNTIIFECFGSKYGAFRMFWVEIRYVSNVLDRNTRRWGQWLWHYWTQWSHVVLKTLQKHENSIETTLSSFQNQYENVFWKFDFIFCIFGKKCMCKPVPHEGGTGFWASPLELIFQKNYTVKLSL